WQRDLPEPALADLRMAVSGDPVPGHSSARLSVERGIEVGHIFQLARNYSTPMRAQFLDRDGKLCDFIMGCYGIGVSRVVAAAIEQNHDERGIVWPDSLAPFTVFIIALNYAKSVAVRTQADDLYQQLSGLGIDVALDDRPQRPGAKFIDADLLGIPHQIVIGDKGLQRNIVEYKHRPVAQTHDWPVTETVTRLQERLNTTG
nr:proline--tRNA ligase [Pseudomonadota bacterium]